MRNLLILIGCIALVGPAIADDDEGLVIKNNRCNGILNCNSSSVSYDSHDRYTDESVSQGQLQGQTQSNRAYGGDGGSARAYSGDSESESSSGVYGSGNSYVGGDRDYSREYTSNDSEASNRTSVDSSSRTYVGGDRSYSDDDTTTNVSNRYHSDDDVDTRLSTRSDDDVSTTVEGDSYISTYKVPPVAMAGFANNLIQGCDRILGFDFRGASNNHAGGASFGIPLPNRDCKLDKATAQAFALGNTHLGWHLFCTQKAVWRGFRRASEALFIGTKLTKKESVSGCIASSVELTLSVTSNEYAETDYMTRDEVSAVVERVFVASH